VVFDMRDQLPMRSFAFVGYWRTMEYDETVRQVFVDFKRAYESVRREEFCNILIEFGVPMKLVKLNKLCLNETYSKVRIGKYLSDNFPYPERSKRRRWFIANAFRLCFRICH
jgi:hypothetical protein